MHTTKHPAPDTGNLSLSEPVVADRMAIAREQSVLFPTRLALARWTSGGDIPHLCSNRSPSARASWYDQAQRDFQTWLERGGFTQYDEGASHEGTAHQWATHEWATHPLAGTPACDDDEQQVGACL